MENKKEKDGFHFTYSAEEQEEIKKIRQKYQPKEEADKETGMEKLHKLDAGVTQKAIRASLMLGILGALILGTGMSLAMTDFGEAFGLMGVMGMKAGIAVGIIGIVFICLAYPIYHHILEKERKKAAPEILRLTEELMK